LHDRDAGNTHNIGTLIQEASAFRPKFKIELQEAGFLSQYNQTYRYPGDPSEDFNPGAGELNKAFRLAKKVYKNVWDAMPPEIVGQTKPSQQQIEQKGGQFEDLEP